ncbi:MAG: hypothetical protein ABF242_10490 [Flavobacteriales bacterium]
MKNIILSSLILTVFGCSTDSKKAKEICDCMKFYEINHNETHIKETQKCLTEIGINLDYYNPKNKKYIYREMSEKGRNLCPAESRKFWHFLNTVNKRPKLLQ